MNRLSQRIDGQAKNRMADLEKMLAETTYPKAQERPGSVILREARAVLDHVVETLVR